MIVLHNPNLISWSTCRSYRHKQETGSEPIKEAETGASPVRHLLVRFLIGLFGFPSE